ncbi:MAG: hypothetical protein Aurels2KO_42340 [Aureliella sp.]
MILSWLLGLLSCGCSQVFAQLRFDDVTAEASFSFRHHDGGGENGYLISMMGSGLAVADFDGDGRTDVFLLNGQELPSGKKHPNALMRNLGHTKFSDVVNSSRTNTDRYGLGVCVADFDNDGFLDIAISEFGGITLLCNAGDGTFFDHTGESLLSNSGVAFGAGITFLDIDRDGNLDLFVADYVDFSFERFREVLPKSFPYPPGPEDFTHRSDKLFRSDGRGGFLNVSQSSGISAHRRPSMGAISGDFDADGDSDIFVCCDARPNLLFMNDGMGQFSEEAVLYAAAYNSQAVPVGSMGAAAGDYDNDGIEDLFITSYSGQLPILFQNGGEFGFEDVTMRTRSGISVVPHANWGSSLADFDNDGDKDIFIANGHLMKSVHKVEQMTRFRVANTLMQNTGSGIFNDVSRQSGSGLELVESSRALGVADFDTDGRLDCVVLNNDGPAHLLQNSSKTQNAWIAFRLVGTRMNRSAVGATVTIYTPEGQQVATVHSGSGYQSYDAPLLHFGLGGTTEQVQRVVVNWSGHETEYEDLAAGQVITLVEPK